MYVKTMDTLKPLEQLILKAGSALGYTFKRETLKYVIFKDIQSDEKALGKGELLIFIPEVPNTKSKLVKIVIIN